jgi:outer membrane autotransporter protein
MLAGFAISWATGSIHQAIAGDARTQADSYQFSLYGQYLFGCPFYMNWFTGVSYNDYDATRQVIFPDLTFTPEAIYHAWQYSAKAEVGFVQKLCCKFLIVPVASLYYSLLDFKGYQEIGAGSANQYVNPHDANRLQASAGLRLLYDHFYEKGILQPELRARMFYNFINSSIETTSEFIGGGASFVTSGATPAPLSYNVGASLSTFECAVVATLSYDYVFRKNYESHSGFFRIRYEW